MSLGSFIYNAGPEAFRKSILAPMSEGRMYIAITNWMQYVNSKNRFHPGLAKRRLDEVAKFMSGVGR